MPRWLKTAAAVSGFTAVALGAMGAHVLSHRLSGAVDAAQRMQWWETAALYHLVHSVVLLTLAWLGKPGGTLAGGFFVSGIVLFSGSLYLLALSANRAFSSITPIGGLCLLAGWGVLIWAGMRQRERSD